MSETITSSKKKILLVPGSQEVFSQVAAVMLSFLNSNKTGFFQLFLSTEELNKIWQRSGFNKIILHIHFFITHVHWAPMLWKLTNILCYGCFLRFLRERETQTISQQNPYTSNKAFIKRRIIEWSDCWFNENPLNVGYISESFCKDACNPTYNNNTQQMDGGNLVPFSVMFGS